MEFYNFGPEVGRKIDQFGSVDTILSALVNLKSPAVVNCFYLGKNGMLGLHPASSPQLFLIVQGKGYVRSGTSERIAVTAGTAVFWTKAEWHETSTEKGLTAVVIESDQLDPAEFMPAQ